MNNLYHNLMKLTFGLAVFILLQFAVGQWQPAKAAPNACDVPPVVCKGGALTSDETWQAGKIYVITDNLTVGPGVTLSIEAGAIVKFYSDYYRKYLLIEGTLNVNGTDGHPA